LPGFKVFDRIVICCKIKKIHNEEWKGIPAIIWDVPFSLGKLDELDVTVAEPLGEVNVDKLPEVTVEELLSDVSVDELPDVSADELLDVSVDELLDVSLDELLVVSVDELSDSWPVISVGGVTM